MKGRGGLVWAVVVVVGLGLVAVAGAPPRRNDRPLDPRATGPAGARAMVLLLEELGADVDITSGPPSAATHTAVLFEDRLGTEARAGLRRWIGDGGTLVLLDTVAALAGEGDPEPCPAALADVDALSLGPGPSAEVQRDDGCFAGLVTAASIGEGHLVVVREPRFLLNAFLGRADNAVLAAALLAPTGRERVAFVHGGIGTGEQGLFDLLGPRVAQALGQLAVAMVVYVLWRGRRLGRPVVEEQPVVVAGSELVTAVGHMLESRRRPGDAAATVRADLRRDLDRRLGLPADAPAERVADAVATRTGLDPAWIHHTLQFRPVADDAELLDVIADVDRIRALVFEGDPVRHPPVPTAGGHQ